MVLNSCKLFTDVNFDTACMKINWGIMKILKPFFVSVFIRVNRPVRCVFPRDYDVRSTGKRHGTKAFYKVNTSPT